MQQLTARRVTHIVLTHKHFDHVLGSGAFAGAEIYCAPEVADQMSAGVEKLRVDALKYGAAPDDVQRAIAAAGRRPGYPLRPCSRRRGRRALHRKRTIVATAVSARRRAGIGDCDRRQPQNVTQIIAAHRPQR